MRRYCIDCHRKLGKHEPDNQCGCVTACTPERCAEADKPMIQREHTPRTCKARVDAGLDDEYMRRLSTITGRPIN